MTDLQADPEPLKLFNSVRTLISNLISAITLSQQKSLRCIEAPTSSLFVLIRFCFNSWGLLEIELSTRAQADDEERRRKGQANFTSSTHASASAVSKGGKGRGKGKGKSKGKAKDGKGDKKPVCLDYVTDGGCPRGDQCTHLHPRKPGKRLRCGATGHGLTSCRRPARDVRTNAPPSAKPIHHCLKKEKARAMRKLNQTQGTSRLSKCKCNLGNTGG